MNESERSEAFGTPMSSDDAAELEELRREAALLREQLENAVGPQSGLRSARDVHQLEARIGSLAARNAKLMETLKEARQQLLALREEVDRLGQPPSGYGVLLSVQEDDTVDVFTSGRKMRLTCSPSICRTATTMRSTTICVRASCGPVTRCSSTPRPGTHSSASPRLRSKIWCSKRCLTSATTTSAASAGRSSRSATQSNCRSCTRSSTASTRCARRRACCSTGRPAAVRP